MEQLCSGKTFDPNTSVQCAVPELSALPDLRARVRGHVEEAVDSIALDRKAAYLEARKKAPELVETEADPLKFVRCCDYDAWRAANRMCDYWTERKLLFGERAFLPLILTGNGALTKEDVNTIQAGYPSILPDTKSGQKVLLFDRRKFLPNASTESKLRCMFYAFSFVCQSRTSQTDGVICLIIFVPRRLFDVPEAYHERAMRVVAALPFKSHVHVALISSQSKTHLLQDILAGMLGFMVRTCTSVEVHIEREPGQLVEELEELGLQRPGIPVCIGGEWEFDSFFCWLGKERIPWEKKEYKSLSSSPQKQTEEQKKEKRRMVDLIHSRRKRARKRHEIELLKEETSRIMIDNVKLKAEHTELQVLIVQAKEIIVSLSDGRFYGEQITQYEGKR